MEQVHGTAVAIDGAGVLLLGPAGSGKSDFALRLIDGGAALVSDDRVDVAEKDGALLLSAPAAIAGLIEVRGVGVARLDAVSNVKLRLAVDLVGREAVPRLPEPAEFSLLGVAVPRLALAPFEASAPAKLRLALAAALGATEVRGGFVADTSGEGVQ